MKSENPNVGDIVMLCSPIITEVVDDTAPIKKRGRPKKAKLVTQTTWVDDCEAIVVSGPTQGISSDGEDYWLEWLTQRLDNGHMHVITSRGRWTGSNWRIIQRVNSNA